MKKIFIIMAIILYSAGVYAASITYWEDKPKRKVSYSDVKLLHISENYIEFAHKGKIYKIKRNELYSFFSEPPADNTKTQKAKKQTDLVAPEKSFPTKLAAYILHCRYLFGAGQSDGWHYGKEVTVSGVVDVSEIRLTGRNDLVTSNAAGKYQIPMFNGKIVCLAKELPASLSKKTVAGKKKIYKVMKFRGIVTKSARYKEAFINNVKYISSRAIKDTRKCKVVKIPKDSEAKYISRLGKIASTNNLQYSAFLEQDVEGIGRIRCTMGTDPEAYGMELYWARKIYKLASKLSVTVSGVPYGKNKKYSTLNDGSIVGWGVR